MWVWCVAGRGGGCVVDGGGLDGWRVEGRQVRSGRACGSNGTGDSTTHSHRSREAGIREAQPGTGRHLQAASGGGCGEEAAGRGRGEVSSAPGVSTVVGKSCKSLLAWRTVWKYMSVGRQERTWKSSTPWLLWDSDLGQVTGYWCPRQQQVQAFVISACLLQKLQRFAPMGVT